MNLNTTEELTYEVLDRIAFESDLNPVTRRQHRISEHVREQLWGDLSDNRIEKVIVDIENRVESWRDIYDMIFIFVHSNVGFQCSVFWANSRRPTVAGDNPKAGLSLYNGTVVGAGVIGHVKAAKRFPLKKTLVDAYEAAIDKLEQIETFRRDNVIDDLADFLPVSPARSFILPKETLDYVMNTIRDSTLTTGDMQEKVWSALRSQIRLSKSMNKKRVLDVVIPSLQASPMTTYPLTEFMEVLTRVQKDLQEVTLPKMTEQVAILMTSLDKTAYAYVDTRDGFKVPAGSRQAITEAGNDARSTAVKRTKMVVVEYPSSEG